MSKRSVRRVLAIPVALTVVLALIVNTSAPAHAGTGWTTLYETVRHVKGQACRTGYYDSFSQYRRVVRFRGDLRQASVGGRIQPRVWEPTNDYRWTAPVSGLHWVSKGTYDHNPSVYWTRAPELRVSLRTRTKFGVSNWSRWAWWSGLAWCP